MIQISAQLHDLQVDGSFLIFCFWKALFRGAISKWLQAGHDDRDGPLLGGSEQSLPWSSWVLDASCEGHDRVHSGESGEAERLPSPHSPPGLQLK